MNKEMNIDREYLARSGLEIDVYDNRHVCLRRDNASVTLDWNDVVMLSMVIDGMYEEENFEGDKNG